MGTSEAKIATRREKSDRAPYIQPQPMATERTPIPRIDRADRLSAAKEAAKGDAAADESVLYARSLGFRGGAPEARGSAGGRRLAAPLPRRRHEPGVSVLCGGVVAEKQSRQAPLADHEAAPRCPLPAGGTNVGMGASAAGASAAGASPIRASVFQRQTPR